jgi:hypothetical protein
MNDVEDRLVSTLPGVLDGVELPPGLRTDELVAGGLARGRRRRRVRRLTGLAVAVVAVLAVGLTGALTIPALGRGRAPLASSSSIGEVPVRIAGYPATLDGVVAVLTRILQPYGKVSDGRIAKNSSSREFVVIVTFDDGHGPVAVQVTVSAPTGFQAVPADGCLPSPHCVNDQLPDGSILYGRQYSPVGRAEGSTELSIEYWHLSRIHLDGSGVTIAESNATDVVDSPTTRSLPPFSLDQLGDFVQDPRWTQ